jgi:hypothetical protein
MEVHFHLHLLEVLLWPFVAVVVEFIRLLIVGCPDLFVVVLMCGREKRGGAYSVGCQWYIVFKVSAVHCVQVAGDWMNSRAHGTVGE